MKTKSSTSAIRINLIVIIRFITIYILTSLSTLFFKNKSTIKVVSITFNYT